MTTSLYDRILAIPSNAAGDNEAVDTITARAIRSNLSQLADQSAQVLAAWAHSTNRLSVTLGAAGATNYQLMWSSAAFPVRRRPDGTPYRLRVALRANHGGSGNVEFVVLVTPGGWGDQWFTYVRNLIAGRVPTTVRATALVGGVPMAWLTLDRTWVRMQDGANSLRSQTAGTLEEIGGRADTARYDTQRIYVLCRTATGGGGSAFLNGVYAAEYIGT